MHTKKVLFAKLPHCPENQLRKNNHKFEYFEYKTGATRICKQADAGWDLAAAEDILIKPYGTIWNSNNLFQHVVDNELIQLEIDGVVSSHERYRYDLQLIRTGIVIKPTYLGFFDIRPRSGFNGKYGLGIVNSPGTIDAPYTGEICIVAYSLLPFKPIPIKRGEFIAQLVPMIQEEVIFNETSLETIQKDSTGSRGAKGYGSTESISVQ